MGAKWGRRWRWLWLVIPICLTVLLLNKDVHRGSAADAVAGESSPAATTGTRFFLPVVSAPRAPSVELDKFAQGFKTDTITDIANAGDERLFVVQREGVISIVWPDGTIDPTPFLDIRNDVTSDLNWEQGLLGLAFHPNFPETPYFYIVYTDIQHLRIAQLTVNPVNNNVALPNSMKFLMVIKKPRWDNVPSPVHNAGDLTFGPDGYLYIPIGDGGPDPYVATTVPGDPFNNSQNRGTMLGSILRIDVDGNGLTKADCGEGGYTIPPGNPFTGDSGCDEIWATGVRNPWRIDFDPATGKLFVADVGEWLREEIDVLSVNKDAGANLGWHCYEGTVDYRGLSKWDSPQFDQYFANCGTSEDYTFPVYEFDHSNGECSLTGGVVYRGSEYPFFSGRYLYSDFCTGRIWTLSQNADGQWESQRVGQTPIPITTYGRDVHGEVYVGMRDPKGQTNGDVAIYKLVVK
ncbi:MAG: PQQ-dependent sugar dehydrogenase [Chloroflexota bacterium]